MEEDRGGRVDQDQGLGPPHGESSGRRQAAKAAKKLHLKQETQGSGGGGRGGVGGS